MGLQRHLQIFSRQFYTQILLFAIKIPRHYPNTDSQESGI